MKTGALIFAYNNDSIDYLSIARWNAENIRRHLDIPVTVVTDSLGTIDGFDSVIKLDRPAAEKRTFEDFNTTVDWYNSNRSSAFRLTPYDRTLLLDADYVVASSELHYLLDSEKPDFAFFNKAYSISRQSDDIIEQYTTFGEYKYPMSWATVLVFNRCKIAEYIFDHINMIKTHWQHYRELYHINRPAFRNDYALSIALGLFNGYAGPVSSLPYSMATVLPDHRLEQLNRDEYFVHYKNFTGDDTWTRISNTDFHAMCKRSLGEIVAAQS